MNNPEPVNLDELVEAVKANAVIEHSRDDGLIKTLVGSAVSYACAYQHVAANYYEAHAMRVSDGLCKGLLRGCLYECECC